MRRYFFNIEGNGIEIADATGVEIPSSSDIPGVLEALIAEVACEENWLDELNIRYTMRVADDTGSTVALVPLDRTPGAQRWMQFGEHDAVFAD